jgi:hypothetical protein
MSRWTYALTSDERACATTVARIRNTHNGGQTNIPGGETASSDERLSQHYVACLAEIGTSRLLDRAWTGCGRGSDGVADVGGCIEVRSITKPHLGLLVRGKDHDAAYVLVLVESPNLTTLLGWETKSHIQEHGIHRDALTAKPFWTLRQDQLQPMSALSPEVCRGVVVIAGGPSHGTL